MKTALAELQFGGRVMRLPCVGFPIVVLFLLQPAISRADDPDVKKALDKVSEAVGGVDNAAKLKAVFLKARAVFNDGSGATIHIVLSSEGFDKVNVEMVIGGPKGGDRAIYVVNGNQCWVKDPNSGVTLDVTKSQVQPFRQLMFATIIAASPANMHGDDLKVEHGGNAKVGDADAYILRISRPDEPDASVYYDKKTNLPLKCETSLRELKPGKEIPYEFRFSDFKTTDGVKCFNKVKIIRDGIKVCEFELSELKVSQKFEDATFSKP
jgi:hypothetical protein